MKICIDAGHNYSGYDTGAQGNGLREERITQPIAYKIAEILRSAGLEIIETRPTLESNCNNTSLNNSINYRANFCNSNNCDYFVSIHCNAGGGTGTETLVYSKGGTAERFANYIQDSVVSTLGTKSRGVKVQNVGVLRLTNCPAALVETAFIDTASDAELLKNRQDDFAKAIAGGIMNFLGISQKKEPTIDEMKSYIAYKCGYDNPLGVFVKMDEHPYKYDLYRKWYESYGVQ